MATPNRTAAGKAATPLSPPPAPDFTADKELAALRAENEQLRLAATPLAGMLKMQTDVDRYSLHPWLLDAGAALVVNSAAHGRALMGAAVGRTKMIDGSLNAWLCVRENDANLQDILTPLLHLAQEIGILLEAIERHLPEVEARHG